MAAFVLARYPFRGRELVYGLFTIGLLFPIAVAILPLFVTLRQVGLLSNPLGVALPQAAFALPLAIVIMRPFFRAIPQELQDAAAIDGCGPLRFYWSVMLPLSRPVLSTVAVLTIVGSWNAFLLPLLVLDRPRRAHPADRRQQHLHPVLDRLRARARLHDVVDDPGADLLRGRRTSDHRWPDRRRGQGLNPCPPPPEPRGPRHDAHR